MTEQPQHHRYSASGSDGTLACPGKVAMELGKPDSYSPYADEGSAAHFVGSTCLESGTQPEDYLGLEVICWQKAGDRDGQCFASQELPEGATERSRWEVTEEMVEHLNNYVGIVRKHLSMNPGAKLFVETRVHFGNFVGLPGAFGTADCIIVTADGAQILVIDLKYGRKPVPASAPQLKLYALGAIETIGEQIDLSKLRSIWCQIVQPRINNYPEQLYLPSQLYEFANEFKDAITRSEEALLTLKDIPNLFFDSFDDWAAEYLKYSEKGCTWCKARQAMTCPEYVRNAVETVYEAMPIVQADLDDLPDLDGELVPTRPTATQALAMPQASFEQSLQTAIGNVPNLSLDVIAKLYKASALFDEFRDAVAKRLHTELMNGSEHPDWKLVRGRAGNRKWRSAEEAEATMKSMKLKIDEMYDKKVIGPTKAEKLLKENPRKWKKLEELITREEGNITLAPATDKREAYLPPMVSALDELPDMNEPEDGAFGDLII